MTTRKSLCFIGIFLIVCWIYPTKGAVHQTTHCCDLGKNYANSDVACDNIQAPIPGIAPRDVKSCLSTLLLCCKSQTKENDCALGINDAQTGNCNSPAGSERQQCCEACNQGRVEATSGTCDNNLRLSSPYDKHFRSCCEKLLPKTTSPGRLTKKDEQVSIENLCEIGELCAQICIPTADSHRCDCRPGYTLMADGSSCKEVKKKSNTAKRGTGCEENNPCAHQCVDTGSVIYCTCNDGYELAKDKRSCLDIDECARGQHECLENEECVNGDGYYDCISDDDGIDYDFECPKGYKYNWDTKKCEDIDECQLPLTCLPGEECKNKDGTYECIPGEPICPPGYFYKSSTQDCADVDECVTGANDCNRDSQVCLNNKGSYTCVDKASKKTCPPGYMMHPGLEICVDIDECAQEIPLCAADELCVNEEGGHTCVPKGRDPKPVIPTSISSRPTTTSTTTTTTTTTRRPSTTTTTTRKPTTTTATTRKPTTSTTTTTTTTKPTTKATTTTTTTTTTPRPTTTTTRRTTTTIRSTPTFISQITKKPSIPTPPVFRKPPAITCNRGYRYSDETKQCEDIDECQEGTSNCDNYQQCHNTLGGHICNCKIGFRKDPLTDACTDVNECQMGLSDCTDGQRCDNTVGSYLCSRLASCGTGYTLNYETGNCEDDDECALGTHSCDKMGRNLVCRNTQGSYRCDRQPVVRPRPTSPATPPPLPPRPPYTHNTHNQPTYNIYFRPVHPANYPNFTIVNTQSKRCLPGYYMDSHGACQDIDECQSNPCPRGQKCINLNGRYDCISQIHCTAGYELNTSGDACIDVNECIRGTHHCDVTEICKNHVGFYRCECPAGHIKRDRGCVDIDECLFYNGRTCPISADCKNTMGSYYCECKKGFNKVGDQCIDIDECKDIAHCEHKCQNSWGSYKCYCEKGFTLNYDNRTCADVDECKLFTDQLKCVGTCINTPGSYQCDCPAGFRLGTDGRTCQDIDECASGQTNPCKAPNTICYNTRGGYECPSIACPPNFIMDKHHKSRCKYDAESCRYYGSCDNREADQISFHFFNIVSNSQIYDEPIKFFKMNGPKHSKVSFKLEVKNVLCPHHVQRANIGFFRMDQEDNSATVSIVKTLQGPQTIHITLQMQIFNHNILANTVLSKIIFYVSQYSF